MINMYGLIIAYYDFECVLLKEMFKFSRSIYVGELGECSMGLEFLEL